MKAAMIEQDHGIGRVYEHYWHSKKGIEMGEQFMVLDIIADSIPNDCIERKTLHHKRFFCEHHPHPVVRSYDRDKYPYDDVKVTEEMIVLLRSYEFLKWIGMFLEEYTSVTKHEGLLEKVYDFHIDNNFYKNPLVMNYEKRMATISQANILQEHNPMLEHEENIIKAQEESLKNDEPEKHRYEGWNDHCPETPTNGNSFDIINLQLDEISEGLTCNSSSSWL